MRMLRILLSVLFLIPNLVFAAPSNTLSITPIAVDGATITASDENSRNNTTSTTYNAHSHTDISQTANTLNVGDLTAGNKTIAAYNADSNKPFVRYDDSADDWIFSVDGTNSAMSLSGSGLTFEGDTADDFETTVSVIDPTADRTITFPNASGTIALGVALPSGAAFYMFSGSCPSGTTDSTSTYSNKFIKINATQLTSSGTVLTGTSDSTTLSAAQSGLPAHTHSIPGKSGGAVGTTANFPRADTLTLDGNITSDSTGGSAASSGHTHTFSSATTLEPSSITAKLCIVN